MSWKAKLLIAVFYGLLVALSFLVNLFLRTG